MSVLLIRPTVKVVDKFGLKLPWPDGKAYLDGHQPDARSKSCVMLLTFILIVISIPSPLALSFQA